MRNNGNKKEIENLQTRVQELYDIPLLQLTPKDIKELRALEQKADEIGCERVDDGNIYAIRYAPKQK